MGLSQSQLKLPHPLEDIYELDTGSGGPDWQYDPDWEPWEKELEKKKISSQSSQSGDLGESKSVHSVIDLEAEDDNDTSNSVICLEEEVRTTGNLVNALDAVQGEDTTSTSGSEIHHDSEDETGNLKEKVSNSVTGSEAEEETDISVIDLEAEESGQSVICLESEEDTVNSKNVEKEVDPSPRDPERKEEKSLPEKRPTNDSDSVIINYEFVPLQRLKKRKRRVERRRCEQESHEERQERKRKRREWKESQEYQDSLLIESRPESTFGVLGEHERPPSHENYENATVEKIIARRTSVQGVKYFLVKWRDRSSDYNSWEPEDKLVDCQNAIHEFMKERKERKLMKRKRAL